MNLQPDPETPGLWVNPRWQAGMPGSFAVVIGVSAYPHLDGGAEPADDHGQEWIAETRSLGQLYVSASTARRVARCSSGARAIPSAARPASATWSARNRSEG